MASGMPPRRGCAGQLGVELPGARAVRSAFAAAAQQGLAEQDYSAVFHWLEQQAAARTAAT